ncbi:Uncharacterized protein dnm_076410 [Desulfonema magnum]|uniref:Uncharacterized protein n=1 Tax=Desulfonema magnum TaxID=45655 RepID=A0A975GS09_9BACT|nr:Uncharacterized protein dnm_076410 [Desulfonema magnum]
MNKEKLRQPEAPARFHIRLSVRGGLRFAGPARFRPCHRPVLSHELGFCGIFFSEIT